MLISCRTSSYFSSIDKRPPPPSVLNPMQQILFLLPQGVDLVSVLAGPQFLQAVDLALDFGAHHLFRNARFVCDPVGELIPGRRIGNPGGHLEHFAEKLAAAVILSEIEP